MADKTTNEALQDVVTALSDLLDCAVDEGRDLAAGYPFGTELGELVAGAQEWLQRQTECQWFAGCSNEADGMVPHPVLGDVPTCRRCADKLELPLAVFPS